MIKCVSHAIDYRSRKDTFTLVPLGDIHLGNETCDEVLLIETVKRIADDPHCYWAGMGDYCDFINRKDKRFDEEALPSWLWGVGDLAKAQREKIIEILEPIGGDKCLGLIEGNHERTIYERQERDVYTTIAEALGAPCLGPMGFIKLNFRRMCVEGYTLKILATHGWWGGRLMGAGALNLERVLGWCNADLMLAGHDHKRRAFPMTRLFCLSGKDEVEHRLCYAASTGAFLDGAKYATAKGYRPVPLGPLEVIVRPDKREIKVLQ